MISPDQGLGGKDDGSRIVRHWTEGDHPFVQKAARLSHFDLSVGVFELGVATLGRR